MVEKYFDLLKTDLETLELTIETILNHLTDYNGPTREDIIHQTYTKYINKHFDWIHTIKTTKSEKLKGLTETSNGSSKNPDINRILKAVASQPAKKIVLIQEYLDLFPAIGDADKKVLLDNFKSLNEAELEQELKNIFEIFGS